MNKALDAFRTISEVADELDIPKHVLRFWEVKFPQIKPMKRGGGRRYYRPQDVVLLRGIRNLLHAEGYTIKGVQKILREQGIDEVKQFADAPPAQKRTGQDKTLGAGRIRKLSKQLLSGGKGGSTGSDVIDLAIRELEACRSSLKAVTASNALMEKRPPRPTRSRSR